MLKKFALLLALCLLLLAACQGNTPEEPSGNQLSDSQTTEPTSTAPEETYFDIWDYTPPTSDDPMALCNIFPDPYFAWHVASALGKSVTDVVSYEELAAYTGELSCARSPMKSIEGIGYLTGLTSFGCGMNGDLEIIPDEFGKLTNLTSISLMKAWALRSIPSSIGNLKKLRVLTLSLTMIEELPKEIGGCESLKVLDIHNTPIQEIPAEIRNCKELVYLDADETKITSLPDSICKLTKLKSLDVGYTKLTALPEEIGNLSELERLDLFGCQLKTLPSSVRQLKNLRYLNVYDNFSLDEAYMNWFPEPVYTCKDDPQSDVVWMAKWYYVEGF